MGAIYDRLRLWPGVPLPAGPFNWVIGERSYMGSVIEIACRVEWERPVLFGEGDLLDQPGGPRRPQVPAEVLSLTLWADLLGRDQRMYLCPSS